MHRRRAIVSARILVVDDDSSIRRTFAHHLADGGHEVSVAPDATSALAQIGALDPALVITDVRMPGMTGLELLARVKESRPDIDVVVMTAHEDMRTAINAMKAGAYDYLVKPLDLDHIDLVVERCLRDRSLRVRAQQLSEAAAEPFSLDRIVGRHPAMITTYKLIGQVAGTRTPVLVRGETGTGKELVARAIHYHSDAADQPFVALNCAAVTETLLESELFGHTRGAFTGAMSDRKGRFELAGRGTLFLDEIGDTSPAFQTKLLRVLQEHEYSPVGSERVRRTEARVIAATNRDLEDAVRSGRFREDLYYRLRVVEIRVPSLRERREDVALLAEHFVARMTREQHTSQVVISLQATRALAAYGWPGNVRELENTMARALVLARGGVIGVEHLSLGVATVGAANEGDALADESLEAMERLHVTRILRLSAWNKRQAAQRLGVSRPTLDRMIEKYGITEQAARASDAKERYPEGNAT